MSDLIVCDDGRTRCSYRVDDLHYREYHDLRFGRPTASDREIFAKLCIEIFASGMSFHGVLAKLPAIEQAFRRFEIDAVAGLNDGDIDRIMDTDGVIRNRRKIEAVVANAKCVQGIVDDYGSLAAFVWQHEPDPFTRPSPITYETVAANTQSVYSERLAQDLKVRGVKFVGPVSMYGVLQGCGLINDHFDGCDFRDVCLAERRDFDVPRRR